jgi:hypothetical protein
MGYLYWILLGLWMIWTWYQTDDLWKYVVLDFQDDDPRVIPYTFLDNYFNLHSPDVLCQVNL